MVLTRHEDALWPGRRRAEIGPSADWVSLHWKQRGEPLCAGGYRNGFSTAKTWKRRSRSSTTRGRVAVKKDLARRWASAGT